jgi:multidrug efflux system outer membrane protein
VEVARGDIARYSQLVAQDLNALDLLTGTPAPRGALPRDLSGVTPPQEISPGLSSEVLLGRPDVMAAEYRLKGAYAFIGAARAAFFPRISLTSSIGSASSDLDALFDEGRKTWLFSPQAVMPIFDARTWAALRVSKVQREMALAEYEKTIQSAFRDVADALAVKGTIDRQVAAQQSLVQAVSETYTLSEQRYANGIDSYLGVLDAQRSLFAAQQGLINLRLAKYANDVALYAVLGGGVDRDEPEATE